MASWLPGCDQTVGAPPGLDVEPDITGFRSPPGIPALGDGCDAVQSVWRGVLRVGGGNARSSSARSSWSAECRGRRLFMWKPNSEAVLHAVPASRYQPLNVRVDRYVAVMDWKLELVIIPVTDVDRAKSFYADQVGFHVDHDASPTADIRFVQLTPKGSA